jgi:hypothetical protein
MDYYYMCPKERVAVDPTVMMMDESEETIDDGSAGFTSNWNSEDGNGGRKHFPKPFLDFEKF